MRQRIFRFEPGPRLRRTEILETAIRIGDGCSEIDVIDVASGGDGIDERLFQWAPSCNKRTAIELPTRGDGSVRYMKPACRNVSEASVLILSLPSFSPNITSSECDHLTHPGMVPRNGLLP